MYLTSPAPTTDWSLDAVIAHLSGQPEIDGVMQIGSLTNDAFSPTSDYDLVIVLHDLPTPWYVGVTIIDGRFTDLLFVDAVALGRIAALATPIALQDPLAPIVRWLQQGRIIHDRSGRLATAREHVTATSWVKPTPEEDVYGSWFAINYDLAQARRMLASDDPLYSATVDVRMAIFGHMDVWTGYFTIRRLPYAGEKEAIRYLLAHDLDFLTHYQQFIAESERHAKFDHYERVAALAIAPCGAPWSDDTTAMNLPHSLDRWIALFDADRGHGTASPRVARPHT